MITFNKNDYDKILEYAKVNLPEEACGLIGGTIEDGNKYIKKVYLLTNIDHSNEHFSMDPKEQLAAVKDMSCIKRAPEFDFKILQFNAVVASNKAALHLYKKLGFIQLGIIPKGFLLKDGTYEDIIPHYLTLIHS